MKGKIIFKITSFQNNESFSTNLVYTIDHDSREKECYTQITGMRDVIDYCLNEADDRRKEKVVIEINKVLPCCRFCKYYSKSLFCSWCAFWQRSECTNKGDAWCYQFEKLENLFTKGVKNEKETLSL